MLDIPKVAHVMNYDMPEDVEKTRRLVVNPYNVAHPHDDEVVEAHLKGHDG